MTNQIKVPNFKACEYLYLVKKHCLKVKVHPRKWRFKVGANRCKRILLSIQICKGRFSCNEVPSYTNLKTFLKVAELAESGVMSSLIIDTLMSVIGKFLYTRRAALGIVFMGLLIMKAPNLGCRLPI